MDKELKAKWIGALRSGEYQQATGRLRRIQNGVEGYCCLGVLCSISGKGEWSSPTPIGSWKFHYQGESSNGFLPSGMSADLGLPSGVVDECINKNDNGEPFVAIADYLEAAPFS